MPVLSHGGLEIEYSDAGDGPAVVPIHCSVSGIRQWRSLTEVLADRYRVRALNLYGYGATTPWPEGETQTLDAQARIVVAACEGLPEPVSLVGHSFGGTVALKAATLLGARVGSMVLIEPNPVYLLAQGGRDEEFAEVCALRDHVKHFGARRRVGGGRGALRGLLGGRRRLERDARGAPRRLRRPAAAELPRMGRRDGRGDDRRGPGRAGCRTLVMSDPATRRPIRAIAEILAQACPDGRSATSPRAATWRQ